MTPHAILRAALALERMRADIPHIEDEDAAATLDECRARLALAIDDARGRFVDACAPLPAVETEESLGAWDDARDDAASSFDFILRIYRLHGDEEAALRLLAREEELA